MKLAKLLIGFALALVLGTGCLDNAALPDEWPCNSNADCPRSEKCFETLDGKRCIPKNFCHSTHDCAADEICRNSACVKVQCKDNSPCGAYACDTITTNTCQPSCQNSSHCSSGNLCIQRQCRPPECADDSACQGYSCVNGVCGRSCLAESECAVGYACIGSLCQFTGEGVPCTTTTQCTMAPYTFCDSGTCQVPCSQRPCVDFCGFCGGVAHMCGATGFCEVCPGFCL